MCSALHALKLIKAIKNRGPQDNILYYFLCSKEGFVTEYGCEIKKIHSSKTLKEHTYYIQQKSQFKSLYEKIIGEIQPKKTHYQRKLGDGTSQTRSLSTSLERNFQAFLHPGYYVDALLDISKDKEERNQ